MLVYSKFTEHYYKKDQKFADNWNETINLLPFTSNTSTSSYDKTCGLLGVTGEFFRKWENKEILPVADYKEQIYKPVRAFLEENGQMDSKEIKGLMNVVKDIIFPDNRMNIVDTSFLPFIPLVDKSLDDKSNRVGKKYKDGQKKIADYLYSMLNNESKACSLSSGATSNLFSYTITQGLQLGTFNFEVLPSKYYILPFISSAFNDDLKWLMQKEDYLIVKNIHFLLHFYVCLSLSQTIAHIIHWDRFKSSDIIPFYYMLTSEHASKSRQVVMSGWDKWIGTDGLQQLFGRTQALDIFNTLLGKSVGLYDEIIQVLGEDSFHENKEVCEAVLSSYSQSKSKLLSDRKNSTLNADNSEYDHSVSSYEEFFKKLTKLCSELQSSEYKNKILRKVRDLFEIKFLENRRGMKVLTLDEDLLIFLIAMVTREKKTKVDNMYKYFNDSYGIYFDINTRNSIENLLIKNDLLERKSDSGEAQYVTVIL